MTIKHFINGFLFVFLLFGTHSFSAQAKTPNQSNLNFDDMVKDVKYLSSDKLAGRKAFSKEIELAADYIAKRFSQAGLKPLDGQDGYLQSFSIFNLIPENASVSINGRDIDKDKIVVVSRHQTLEWQDASKIETLIISSEQELRGALEKINRIGKDAIVYIDPAHQKNFVRYRNYFNRGKTLFEINQGNSVVFIISKPINIDTLTVKAIAKVEERKLSNVVGILPGKSLANEFVLYSAHYDHVGVDPKLEGDQIFNGADDNASGTTAVINLAQHFASLKNNERSLMFVAFTAEEIGGFGSKYFSKNINPASISAMINIEMIGKTSKFGAGGVWMTGFDRSNLALLLNEALGKTAIHPDPYPNQNLFYRSDNATLARLGVPAHSFSSVQIEQDKHYHQVSDEFETLDLESMFSVIQALAQSTQLINSGKVTPSRVDTKNLKNGGILAKGVLF